MLVNKLRNTKWTKIFRVHYFLLTLIPAISFCQISKLDIKSERLLFQLGAGYLNVARQNQIDLDSGLALAAYRTHLSPMVVIGENLNDIIQNPENDWITKQVITGAKKQLLTSIGKTRIQLLTLIGSNIPMHISMLQTL
jgi:hypothetical protein